MQGAPPLCPMRRKARNVGARNDGDDNGIDCMQVTAPRDGAPLPVATEAGRIGLAGSCWGLAGEDAGLATTAIGSKIDGDDVFSQVTSPTKLVPDRGEDPGLAKEVATEATEWESEAMLRATAAKLNSHCDSFGASVTEAGEVSKDASSAAQT